MTEKKLLKLHTVVKHKERNCPVHDPLLCQVFLIIAPCLISFYKDNSVTTLRILLKLHTLTDLSSRQCCVQISLLFLVFFLDYFPLFNFFITGITK